MTDQPARKRARDKPRDPARAADKYAAEREARARKIVAARMDSILHGKRRPVQTDFESFDPHKW